MKIFQGTIPSKQRIRWIREFGRLGLNTRMLIFLGCYLEAKTIRAPFPISNNVTRLASSLIRVELKDFSLNMIFLANYVQSFHRTHYVCDFCFFSSRKRRKTIFVLSLSSRRALSPPFRWHLTPLWLLYMFSIKKRSYFNGDSSRRGGRVVEGARLLSE